MKSFRANSDPSAQSNSVAYPVSVVSFRWIGYVLLVLFLMDVAVLLYPLDLMNPEWEFQTVGNIIERIVVPIIGLGFIFWGEANLRRKWERLFLNILTWATLLAGTILIVVFPIVIATSSQRIAVQIDTSFGDQYQKQISQAQAIQKQIEAASRSELETLITSQEENVQDTSPENVRQRLLEDISLAKQQVRNQTQQEINQRKNLVKKNAIKWVMASILSGFLLTYLWHITRWARLSISDMKQVATAKPKERRV